ncbi:MAG: hypothetical protein ACREQ5_10710 [Candidatus Dormibacteria bacterium]
MREDGQPDNVDEMYEAWVNSLKRDKRRLSKAAGASLAAAVLLALVLAVLLWGSRSGPVHHEHDEEGEDQ